MGETRQRRLKWLIGRVDWCAENTTGDPRELYWRAVRDLGEYVYKQKNRVTIASDPNQKKRAT